MQHPGRRVTIYDVAARAGVSISTVSLAVNSPHRVREQTRARVLAAAGALGYRIGEPPARRQVGTRIAVAAPFRSYPTYLRRLTGMLARTRNTAIELITHDLESAAQSTAPLLDALPARRGIDGLIVMGVPFSSAALRASRESRLPVVFVDVRTSSRSSPAPSAVLVDDLSGGRAIGRHLRERGHQKAIFLHELQRSGDYVSAAMVRVAGIQESIEIVDTVCPPSAAPGDIASSVLRAHPDATAVIAHHDELAASVWHHFRAHGHGGEHRVALVGYDDGVLAETIGLTTVQQPFEESGAEALTLIIEEITAGERDPRTVTLQPELVVRSST